MVGKGRAVVVIVSVDVAGLVPVNVRLAVENVHFAPVVGKPCEHERATLFGNVGKGVTVTWYVVEFPAATVCVAGAAVTLKSATGMLTCAPLFADTGSIDGGLLLGDTEAVPLVTSGCATVGVSGTVTVAV